MNNEDTEMIGKLIKERRRILANIADLQDQAKALTDYQIGKKFGISGLEVRKIALGARGHRCVDNGSMFMAVCKDCGRDME